ncbi:MAG: FtsX-like permease family protein, partial [Candidatus Marinimicrobia bacterium]|nr:FtsX-like permease family protein [Candidatus Neomarinimicrobiota bacterium]
VGGLLLGSGLVQLVSRTINDLYFVVTVTNLNIEPVTVLKGIGLGIGATLLAALAPAREATKSPPRVALSRSQIESKTREKAPRLALLGLAVILTGAIFLSIPSDKIILGYAGLLPIIMGFALFTPIILISMVRLLRPVFRKSMGLIGGMASQSIVTQLSRSAVAIAALGIAVSATIGVTTSVQSFRNSVEQWLTTTLQADVYISPPGMVSRRNYQLMDDAILDSIRAVPGVTDISTSRFFSENVNGKIIDIGMINIGSRGYDRYEFKSGNPGDIWDTWQTEDAVIISEPYSLQNDVSVGDTITLPTEKGGIQFAVLGVYFDYGSDIGTALVSRETYHRYWTGDNLTAVALYATTGTSVDTVIQRLRTAFAGSQFENVIVRSNRALRDASLTIFDRTFTITRVLQILTIIVALIGVLSALMALQLERAWEVGVMRAIGLTPGQLRKMVLTQTGLMGTFAGLLAVPLGVILAIILIYVVNQRSFGWTLQLSLTFESLVLAVLLSIIAAVIAGIYPAIKMGQMQLTSALREE